ncbi:hypothetical protein RRG08_003778 [Elysia crispata]|uniref:Tetratricopeptide SHNi-TPR domain-containing protein n=1 Tax=Elysia crispata TaxID=231223 RepID=A0AAE1AVH4_9GAST|nr:hypothetical protein RRG08_003778 [Elysia crispata]
MKNKNNQPLGTSRQTNKNHGIKPKMATEGCTSSTSVADSTEKQEIMKKAAELLAQGKRNVVCGEVPKAISLFDEAVQMLAKEYGDLSRNCVDAYFNYGSALLELGRMETNVLGVALEGVDVDAKEDEAESDQFEKPPAEDGEEREKLRSEVYDAMAEGEREKQIEMAEDSNTDKNNTDDNKDSREMETDDGKLDSLQKDNEKEDSNKEKGNDAVDKHSELDDKSKDNNASKNKIDDQNGRSDKSEPKEHESKNENIDKDKSESKDNTKAENVSKAKSLLNEDKSKEKIEDKEMEEKSNDKIEKVSQDKDEVGNDEKGENSEQKQDTKKEKVEDTKESPGKILAQVDQQKTGEEKQNCKEVHVEDGKESSVKILSEVDQQKAGDEKHTCREANKETLLSEEKENLPTDKDVSSDTKEKECLDNKVDTDVEMAESSNDKEGEEEVEDDEEEAPEGEDEQAQEEGDNQEGAESQEDEEKDEDVPNFQLAWEYLELAKVIYLKSDNKDDQLKAAECHIKLGEVSMETEQHSTAAEDLESALKIQQKYLVPEDRVIAETHYQLGLAYGLGKEFELSIQHYQQAISVIEAKIASLNKLVEDNEKGTEDKENCEKENVQKYKDEIKELQELIPEMNSKIEDTKMEAKDMEKVKEMAKEMLGLSGTTKGFGSPTKKAEIGSENVDENGQKKASDISSLVRKKRKPEEEATAGSGAEVKKIKQDDGAALSTKILPEKESDKEMEETKVNANEEVKVNGTPEVKANSDATDTEMATAS